MKLIKTNDNSYTFYSKEYSENYHSISGALEESLKKFIEPCRIKDGMKILDIGFGLGYNVLMAIHTAKNLKIISLEKDSEILKELSSLDIPDYLKEDFDKVKIVAKKLYFNDSNTEIRVLLGDANETIKELNETFDAVFLDPFSPKKNPELWTLEFFKEIKKRMKQSGVLVTYSCASSVRKNLKDAGFIIKDGPCVGRRAPSTIARVD